MCDTIAGDGSTAINQLLNVIIYVRAGPGAPPRAPAPPRPRAPGSQRSQHINPRQTSSDRPILIET